MVLSLHDLTQQLGMLLAKEPELRDAPMIAVIIAPSRHMDISYLVSI